MANSGKNTNSSQFFFTLRPVQYLNGKHVVFGEVIDGMDTLYEIEKLKTDQKTQRPLKSVTISNCGTIDDETGNDIPSVGTTTMNNKNHAAVSSTPATSTTKPAFGVCSPFSSSANTGKPAFGAGFLGSSLPSTTTSTSITTSPFGIVASSFSFKPAASANNIAGGQSGGFGNATTTTGGFGSLANAAAGTTSTMPPSVAATFGSVSSIGGRPAFETGGTNKVAAASPLSSTTSSTTGGAFGSGFRNINNTSTNATTTFGSLANFDNATSTTQSAFVSAFGSKKTPSTSVFGASSISSGNSVPSSFTAFGGASSPSSVFGNNSMNNKTNTNASLFGGGSSSSPFAAAAAADVATAGNAFTSMNNTRSSTSNDIDDDEDDDSDDGNNDGYSEYSNTDSESDGSNF